MQSITRGIILRKKVKATNKKTNCIKNNPLQENLNKPKKIVKKIFYF